VIARTLGFGLCASTGLAAQHVTMTNRREHKQLFSPGIATSFVCIQGSNWIIYPDKQMTFPPRA